MHTIDDYVRWIAESMGAELSEDKIYKLGQELIRDEKYQEILHELQDKILEEKKVRWRRM